ncbi:MAG: leucine--tRNA ligase [Anaerolineales bacterium]
MNTVPEYKPKKFEPDWQRVWEDADLYKSREGDKKKLYILDYFPYPSGEGLHVGHCRNYVPTDVISRFKRMQGYNVLHPMGWDAFGEPAEQNAIKNNLTPRIITDRNTANYKRQMRMIGTSYDWEREIDSSNPDYYRWTQWMFLKMYRRGLAYRDKNWQWWCPTCSTTLSSHEIDGDQCWRGHKGVSKKEVPAWYFKITDYADELISGLDSVDWPDPIKTMQRNWIGRSDGCEVDFRTVDGDVIPVFTTRPETIFGVTFFVFAPEHHLVQKVTTTEKKQEVEEYIELTIRKSEINRLSDNCEKTGVFTGGFVINPLNSERIPTYIADYVLPNYGAGAVMGVPAHDQRDFEFAKKFELEIRNVITFDLAANNENLEQPFLKSGKMINSGIFDGLPSDNAREQITKYVESHNLGRRAVSYRMRDWLISRQRYWGTPIPIVHCGQCGEVPVSESDLPVLLPDLDDFIPDGSGLSPLARVTEFVNVSCPQCGKLARRETDTMGGFACSSWYFLRFTSPHYNEGPFEPDAMKYWMPVDLYVGGAEHAVLHLLYARFWTKALADEGLLPFREPFTRLVNQGQLHGADGQRMSKSRGNVITPDEIVAEYGADALRIYGLFMAPFENNVDWSTDGIVGAERFLIRIWNLILGYWEPTYDEIDLDLEIDLHHTIQIISDRLENFRFNTMISGLMEFVNTLYRRVNANQWRTATFRECLENLMILLAPISPYISEELWAKTGHDFSVHQQKWPVYHKQVVSFETVDMPVQINGRLRAVIQIETEASQVKALKNAFENPDIQKHMERQEITRVVYVPGKILNIISK